MKNAGSPNFEGSEPSLRLESTAEKLAEDISGERATKLAVAYALGTSSGRLSPPQAFCLSISMVRSPKRFKGLLDPDEVHSLWMGRGEDSLLPIGDADTEFLRYLLFRLKDGAVEVDQKSSDNLQTSSMLGKELSDQTKGTSHLDSVRNFGRVCVLAEELIQRQLSLQEAHALLESISQTGLDFVTAEDYSDPWHALLPLRNLLRNAFLAKPSIELCFPEGLGAFLEDPRNPALHTSFIDSLKESHFSDSATTICLLLLSAIKSFTSAEETLSLYLSLGSAMKDNAVISESVKKAFANYLYIYFAYNGVDLSLETTSLVQPVRQATDGASLWLSRSYRFSSEGDVASALLILRSLEDSGDLGEGSGRPPLPLMQAGLSSWLRILCTIEGGHDNDTRTLQHLFEIARSFPSRGLLLCITAKIAVGHRIANLDELKIYLDENIKFYGGNSLESIVSKIALGILSMTVDRRVSVRLFRSAHSLLLSVGFRDLPGIAKLLLMEATALYSLGRDRECFEALEALTPDRIPCLSKSMFESFLVLRISSALNMDKSASALIQLDELMSTGFHTFGSLAVRVKILVAAIYTVSGQDDLAVSLLSDALKSGPTSSEQIVINRYLAVGYEHLGLYSRSRAVWQAVAEMVPEASAYYLQRSNRFV